MLPNEPQEIRDKDGKVIGYFVDAFAYRELQRQNAAFRERILATLPRATEEQEEEFRRQLATEQWIDGEEAIAEILRELEGGNGKL